MLRVLSLACLLLAIACLFTNPAIAQEPKSPVVILVQMPANVKAEDCAAWLQQNELPGGASVTAIQALNGILIRAESAEAVQAVENIIAAYTGQPVTEIHGDDEPLREAGWTAEADGEAISVIYQLSELKAKEWVTALAPYGIHKPGETPFPIATYVPEGISEIIAVGDDRILITGAYREIIEQLLGTIKSVPLGRTNVRVSMMLVSLTAEQEQNLKLNRDIVPLIDHKLATIQRLVENTPSRLLGKGETTVANGSAGLITFPTDSTPDILIKDVIVGADGMVLLGLQPMNATENEPIGEMAVMQSKVIHHVLVNKFISTAVKMSPAGTGAGENRWLIVSGNLVDKPATGEPRPEEVVPR